MMAVAKDRSSAEEDGNEDDAPAAAARTAAAAVVARDRMCRRGAPGWIVPPMGMQMSTVKLEWEETAETEHVSSLKVRGRESVFQMAKEWTQP